MTYASSGEQHHFSVPVSRRDTPTPLSKPNNSAMQITIASEEEALQLARQAAAQRPHDPNHGWTPKGSVAGRADVTIQGGQIKSATSQDRTQGAVTHYATAPTRPGHIAIPGFGETTIAAAKAGVL